MVYSNEFPPCLIEQVTKIGDCALFAIIEGHHLWRERQTCQLSHFLIQVPLLTELSIRYTNEAARPMLRRSGLGGTGSSAPGISCAAGSPQTVENTCSAMTS